MYSPVVDAPLYHPWNDTFEDFSVAAPLKLIQSILVDTYNPTILISYAPGLVVATCPHTMGEKFFLHKIACIVEG